MNLFLSSVCLLLSDHVRLLLGIVSLKFNLILIRIKALGLRSCLYGRQDGIVRTFLSRVYALFISKARRDVFQDEFTWQNNCKCNREKFSALPGRDEKRPANTFSI